jgi:hypothetical protein
MARTLLNLGKPTTHSLRVDFDDEEIQLIVGARFRPHSEWGFPWSLTLFFGPISLSITGKYTDEMLGCQDEAMREDD